MHDYNSFMPGYDPKKHHRRSFRLPGWDYRWSAIYFITICTHERQDLFDVPTWQAIAKSAWLAIPNQVERAVLGEWIVMPNHLHGLLGLSDDSNKSLPIEPIEMQWITPVDNLSSQLMANALAGSLGAIMRSYKAAVTRRINHKRQTPGAKVWQRGYYERIVRNTEELERVRAYIQHNPDRWAAQEDTLNRLLTRMNLRL